MVVDGRVGKDRVGDSKHREILARRYTFTSQKTSTVNIKSQFVFVHELSGNLWKVYFSTFFLWRCDPTRVMTSSFLRFLDHTQRRSTVSRIPLDEWSPRRRDLYMTIHNTQHSQQTNIHAPGGIRTHDLSRRAAADLRLRPSGHWDRLFFHLPVKWISAWLYKAVFLYGIGTTLNMYGNIRACVCI